jgi:dTDP-4-amino-4,6-dideoxygalactose transaminase
MKIPLSYTPVNHIRLAEVLKQYESVPHTRLLTDFEDRLAQFVPGRTPVAVHSGTSAIHLALKALGIAKGDQVIVPTFTYIGSVNPVLYEGAEPVFVDCDPETWNIDVNVLRDTVKNLISKNKKPKAIIVVHTYGMPCDMQKIEALSKEFEIPVLEDAAEAIGSSIGNRGAGSFGEISVLSFNNNKTFTTYGGGAVLCQSQAVAQKVLFWATQSREARPWYLHAEVGYNYRMSPLSAAMGLAQWPFLDEMLRGRREILERYRNKLMHLGWKGQVERWGQTNAWLSVFTFPDGSTPQQMQNVHASLQLGGIETRPFWNPLHLNPLFAECKFFGGKVAERLFNTGICLPSSNQLSPEDQGKVLNALQIV